MSARAARPTRLILGLLGSPAAALGLTALAGCSSEAKPTVPAALVGAADKYPDIAELAKQTTSRSCGPNNAVCHNAREYPSLRESSDLAHVVGLPCNLNRTQDPTSIDNMCEDIGEKLVIDGFSTRVGFVTATPPDAPTTVHLSLKDPLPAGLDLHTAHASFVRDPAGVAAVSFPIPAAALMALTPGARSLDLAYAALADPSTNPGFRFTASLADYLLPQRFANGMDQVGLGDPNRDGVFGADLGGALVRPGEPMKSYLFLRIIGPLALGPGHPLTNVASTAGEEAQMPIANFQYWDIKDAVPALYCWIAGLQNDGANATAPIDYARCDMSAYPGLNVPAGDAVTYGSVYATVLAPTCAGPCHHAGTKQPTTLFMDGAQATYDVLLGIRGAGPSQMRGAVPYVVKGEPEGSYLLRKMTGGGAIEGARMPIGSELPAASIDAVRTWISQGAFQN